MKRKPKKEFLPFDNTARGRLNIPHGEVEANLDAEKKEKGSRPKRERRKL